MTLLEFIVLEVSEQWGFPWKAVQCSDRDVLFSVVMFQNLLRDGIFLTRFGEYIDCESHLNTV